MRSNGEFKWNGKRIYLSQVLVKQPIGLKPIDDDHWELFYSFHRLGVFNARTLRFSRINIGIKTNDIICKPCPRSIL